MKFLECGGAFWLNRLAERLLSLRRHSSGLQISFIPCVLLALTTGCTHSRESHKPSIIFTRLPSALPEGRPDLLDHIGGRVVDGQPGTQIVLYTHSKGTWFVQPFRSRALTNIESDGRWENVTHLGTDYAALLVTPGYRPQATVPALPAVDKSVLAVAKAKGSSDRLADPKTIHFSGYDWKVRSSAGNRGGKLCDYEPSSVWVDDQGLLHLLIRQDEGVWHCAGISLTRSLGYGTYRFVVSDSVHLPPSAAFAMFTRADKQDEEDKTGVAIELSQWGKTNHANADFVVQPYYIPGNTTHFNVPSGPMTYVLRWDPGSVTFRASTGDSMAARGKITDHVFKSGVPVPGTETIHMEFFYDSYQSQSSVQHPIEIVVQKFEYLP